MELNIAYNFVTRSLYLRYMSPFETAKLFRDKADMYLEMTAYACDEQQRRILHELFEENEKKAELLEETIRSHPRFNDFRLRRRMN